MIGVNDTVLKSYVPREGRALVIRNCAPAWFGSDPVSHSHSAERKALRIMHGKALPSNGTSKIVRALELSLKSPVSLEIVMIRTPGSGDTQFIIDLERKIRTPAMRDRIWLGDAIPHNQMPALMRNCDAGIIAYGRGLGEASLPNRFFEYMAAGLAIIAPSYSAEIEQIMISERIGIAADFDDPRSIASSLEWMAENPEECRQMGLRARRAFEQRYNWDAEFLKLRTAMGAL